MVLLQLDSGVHIAPRARRAAAPMPPSSVKNPPKSRKEQGKALERLPKLTD
jgi:hypothetical protein